MPVLAAGRPAAPRTRFHTLTVTAVEPAAADGSAVAVTLDVPGPLRADFAFLPGQHLTVRADPDGTGEIRRSYSLCSTPAGLARHGTLRIGVRAVEGGAFSTYATGRLTAGDTLGVLTPQGRFTTRPDAARSRRYAAVAAGSGITPVLSLAATVLATEPGSTFTLLYGNRSVASAMFTEELADLKDRHGHRLQLLHVFSREIQQVGLSSGRLTPGTLRELLPALLPGGPVQEWFVCGPQGLVTGVRDVLVELGTDPSAIGSELFHTDTEPPSPPPRSQPRAGQDRAAGPAHELTIRLDGRVSTIRTQPGTTVLDAALTARPELPFSCRTGVCATCRARVVSGRADMGRNLSLSAEEVADDYILTCQSTPASESLTVDFDVV
ncbi:2Fe-2S iron-sulfur cluster-binding protein [Streptomyces sp. NBC_00388]|uniref:2Fe-2S iron-sulfur cluster-binding protein n=1 Tax=Streptomyces sp. NBC_00388 TaxID=2975735 RepID=UPI002E1D5807